MRGVPVHERDRVHDQPGLVVRKERSELTQAGRTSVRGVCTGDREPRSAVNVGTEQKTVGAFVDVGRRHPSHGGTVRPDRDTSVVDDEDEGLGSPPRCRQPYVVVATLGRAVDPPAAQRQAAPQLRLVGSPGDRHSSDLSPLGGTSRITASSGTTVVMSGIEISRSGGSCGR